MERILFAIGGVIGRLLMVIVELIFYAIITRRPKQTALALPLPVRFEHTHIVAGSGHGKTQLLQHLSKRAKPQAAQRCIDDPLCRECELRHTQISPSMLIEWHQRLASESGNHAQ